MAGELSAVDRDFLARAIELSREALHERGKTPFGAVVVVGGEVVGEGTSDVVELADPTAHAEVMALRDAGRRLGRHLLADGVMYTSSEPCPMCLAACYWAQLPRLVFGAGTPEVARNGFEDLRLYRELATTADHRSLREDAAAGELAEQAGEVLREWAARRTEPVEPKL